MQKKKIVTSFFLIITLAYMIFGNPIVVVNNQKLKQEVMAIKTDAVELNEVVPFKWDTVYTFDPYASKEEIEEIIGFKSNSIRETVSEGMVQLLFVKGKMVVCSICGYSDTLGYRIDFSDRIRYSDNAILAVEKDTGIIKLTYKE